MAITFAYKADLGILEIICKGLVSPNDLKAMQAPVFALTEEHNADMHLLDLTLYESSLSTVDILSGVSSYNGKATKKLRIAVIQPISKKAQKDIHFYETACLNRGWNTRVFAERQEAIDWLVNREMK